MMTSLTKTIPHLVKKFVKNICHKNDSHHGHNEHDDHHEHHQHHGHCSKNGCGHHHHHDQKHVCGSTHTECEKNHKDANRQYKEKMNTIILAFLQDNSIDSRQLIKDLITKINEENGSSIKFTEQLYECVVKMSDFCSEFDILIDKLVKISSNDHHQYYDHKCYCVYHNGDSLLMHLFMCSIIVGAKMLEDSIDIQHCYKETMVSNVVINMVIALTHDVGKLDCAVYHKDREFVGFPLHGQASAAFLLNLWKSKIAMNSMKIDYNTWYSICLVSNFHMDFYSSKPESKNHAEIMALARWMGDDIVGELYYLFYGDNLAKFTPKSIQGRKFSNAESLDIHASYFQKTVSKPISMCELKSTLKVGNGILVFAINGSIVGEKTPIDSKILRHPNIIEIDKLTTSSKETIKTYLEEGKVVIVNVPEVVLKTFDDYMPEGNFLKFNLIYSSGVDSELNPISAIISSSTSKSGRALKSYCGKYIKDGMAHASIPYDGICVDYIFKIFDCK